MLRRSFLLFATIVIFSFTGCVKETYDMHKLSKEVQLSPTLALSAINGNIGLSYLEIALNVRINNSIEIADTVDNFLKVDNSENILKPENFEKLKVLIAATNGFPLTVSLKMSLYNSHTNTIDTGTTITAEPILAAAPVGGDGVPVPTLTPTQISFTRDFLSAVPRFDKLILLFIFTTPGSDFVTIKADYRIYFKATLIIKPEINL
jgi:hypothetical protein